jgi:hypothetical protein
MWTPLQTCLCLDCGLLFEIHTCSLLIDFIRFVAFVGITYQLPGSFAKERANGLTSYMKAMGLTDKARITYVFPSCCAFLPAQRLSSALGILASLYRTCQHGWLFRSSGELASGQKPISASSYSFMSSSDSHSQAGPSLSQRLLERVLS